MLEVGWHHSAQPGGDGWWCAVVFFVGTRGAPDLHATFNWRKVEMSNLTAAKAGLYLGSLERLYLLSLRGEKWTPVRRWRCTVLYICGDAFATAAWC